MAETAPGTEVRPGPLVRSVVGLLGGAVTFTALYGASVAFGKAWDFFNFEIVAALAGIGAIVFAAGKIRHTAALALVCIAGTLFVSAVLGYVPISKGLDGLPVKPLYWAAARVGIAGVFVAVAVILSVLHNRAASRTLIRAAAWAVPLVAVAAWYRFAGLAPLQGGQSGFLEVLRIVGLFTVVVVSGVSLCAFVHCAIRAFEIAFPEPGEA